MCVFRPYNKKDTVIVPFLRFLCIFVGIKGLIF
jgi:hypothetical protein